MLRLRRTLLLALVAALLLPLGSARADTSGGAGLPTILHASATSGGADVGAAPRVAPKPKPRPKPTPRPKPKPQPRPKPKPKPQPHPAPSGVFPIRGAFNFGSAEGRFGAPRRGHTHQGQDVIAAEGTRLVSPVAGTVLHASYQAGGAGNYVVIHGRDRRDYVLMHMLHSAVVRVGSSVRAGQTVGMVGNTGASFGAHLHFEIWVGGWQSGGHPIDPLSTLRRWR